MRAKFFKDSTEVLNLLLNMGNNELIILENKKEGKNQNTKC